MDSPEENRIPDSSLSLADEESPTSNYFSSLSPIQSKAVRSMRSFSETNLPPQLPVFTSPHLDLKRESSLLKRDRINAACSDAYEQCDTRLKTDLIPCIEKQVQTHCPPGRGDEFLADPVEVNCMNSADLHSQPDNDFPQQSQSDFIGPKETVEAVYDANVSSKETRVPTLSDQAEDDLPLRSVILAETADNERFDEIIELASENFQDLFEHDMSLDPVSRGQQYKQYVDQIGEAYEGFDNSSRPTSKGYVKDVNQHQQGTRRHLQFEAAKSCTNTITGTSHYHTNSKSPTIVTAMDKLIPYNFEPRGISSIRKPDSYARTITPQPYFCSPEYFRSTQNDRNSAISVPFPSGDSSHLKRICESVSMDLYMIASKKPAGCLSSQEQKSVVGSSYNIANDINCGSQSADKVEELNQVSPNRKRKRLKYSCEIDEGCKNCHCKKSKCLKLYCECFAAGIYCVDSCGCSDCFNKPDYEDSVLEAREQIESRNPLAFVSKVVQHDTDSPANVMDHGNWTTPSSSRHRKGCNCKKSKCLKKYCECYQANVGCSDGCRCEDCRNSFGKKPVSISLLPGNSGVAETACKKDTTLENTYSEKMDTSETGKDDQFSPTWEGLADINHLYQLLDTTDAAKASEAQLNQEMSTPTKAAQASSLSQKRVSPPQIRSQEPRSSTSRGLISGRKFTLQAVPSFPPLTPHTESKDGIKPD